MNDYLKLFWSAVLMAGMFSFIGYDIYLSERRRKQKYETNTVVPQAPLEMPSDGIKEISDVVEPAGKL